MTLISLDRIERRFGDLEVLTGASLRIDAGERVGVIGDNGAGKTTLIRILAGLDDADSGTRSPQRGLRMAYAEQVPKLEPDLSLIAYVRRGDGSFDALEARIRELEEQLTEHPDDHQLLEEYGTLQSRFEAGGGYDRDHVCERVLTGIGFAEADWNKQVAVLSGGEKSRLVLAALMTTPADLLILDEPTNHLDLQGIAFVEDYVRRYPGAVVVVSHDRSFLDASTTRTVEVLDGQTNTFKGNWAAYRKKRDEQLMAEARAFKNQQAFVDKELDYIRRNMAGRMSRQAKGRLKRLQRLNVLSAPRGGKKRGMALTFKSEVRGQSGQVMLEAKQLRIAILKGPVLVEAASFRLHHGETVALLGRNGCGKTTLLNALCGKRGVQGGEIEKAYGVRIGAFSQEVTDLPLDLTVLEALRQLEPKATDGELREHLALFMFCGDDVDAKVEDLSGGEKQRLSLARLTRSDYDLLCLDEPTNHLDITGREGLERAIAAFPGAVILITHDRQILSALADRLLYLENGSLRSFRGGSLAECMAQVDAERDQARAAERSAQPKPIAEPGPINPAANTSTKIRNPLMFERLEQEIMGFEETLESIRADMLLEENYRDSRRMRDLQARESELGEQLAAAYERWENWG